MKVFSNHGIGILLVKKCSTRKESEVGGISTPSNKNLFIFNGKLQSEIQIRYSLDNFF